MREPTRLLGSIAARLGLLCTIAPLGAQELRWQLPPRGAALYTRSLAVDETVEPKGAWCPPIWQGDPQVAAVLAGELAPDRQRRADPTYDMRELLADIALDLRQLRSGKARLEFAPNDRLHPLQAAVVFGDVAADGSQSFEATIEVDAKAARAAATNPNVARLRGTLRGKRVIDRGKGLVTCLSGTAELDVVFPAFVEGTENRPLRNKSIRITDEWKLDVVLAPDDAEFRGRVMKAIRASIDALRKELEKHVDEAFAPDGGDPYHQHAPGELALALLALRRSGEDANDPLLQKGYDRLRRLVIHGTYELAVAIMAMEALYTPPGEWAEMRAGRQKVPMARHPSPADLAIVQGWSKELLGNIDTTVDSAYVRRWHYGPSKDWDNSNTHYALLGLYAAALCGVEISPTVWTAAINHWLQCGNPGPAGAARIAYQQDLAKGARTRGGFTKLASIGWGYHGANPTGSMTTAGIAGLTVCTSALRIQRKGNAKLLGEADAAVRSGFLWLEQNFTIRHNPRSVGDWELYYLYGLERACELNQVALLGDRDWYFEGGLRLCYAQRPEGNWGNWVDTSFGLLFLKKAALPAVTGR